MYVYGHFLLKCFLYAWVKWNLFAVTKWCIQNKVSKTYSMRNKKQSDINNNLFCWTKMVIYNGSNVFATSRRQLPKLSTRVSTWNGSSQNSNPMSTVWKHESISLKPWAQLNKYKINFLYNGSIQFYFIGHCSYNMNFSYQINRIYMQEIKFPSTVCHLWTRHIWNMII